VVVICETQVSGGKYSKVWVAIFVMCIGGEMVKVSVSKSESGMSLCKI